MNKMSGESSLTQQVLVKASAFPVLTLKPPVKISDLSTFAEETLGMIVSHKALHKVKRLLKLIPISSRLLLKMFLNSQSVKDVNIVECKHGVKYPSEYEKGGQMVLFPDVEADGFPESEEDPNPVMAYEEEWFKDFHGAIASDSAQTLMEAMSNVPIPGKPGELLTRDGVFSYSSELVGLWQSASPVIRNKPEKPTVIKTVTQHWWADLRLLVEGGKVAGEDWQSVVTRLQTLVIKAAEYVPVISALAIPKLEEIQAQSSSQAVASTSLMLGSKRLRERPPPVVNFKDIRKPCQDCGKNFLFSATQQQRFKELSSEDPKRCYDCITAKKARFGDKNQAQGSSTSQDQPKAGMPDGAQAQATGGWGSGGASDGSDGQGDSKGKGKGKGKGK